MTVRIIGADVAHGAQRASGLLAHAEGANTVASASYAHAEGAGTTGSGTYAHAEGQNTTASGSQGHAEGVTSVANAAAAHAEGNACVASGANSHAGGLQAKADAFAAWARSGTAPGTIAAVRAQTAIYTASASTNGTTPVVLSFDGASSGAAYGLAIPANAVYLVRAQIVSRIRASTGNARGWVYEATIARDATGNAWLPNGANGAPALTNTWYDTAAGATVGTVAFSVSSNVLQISVAGSTVGLGNAWFATLYVTELVTTS